MKLLLLLVLLALPGLAQDVIEVPGGVVERLEIPGGPTVLLQSVPDLPAVSISLGVNAGSRYEPTGKSGMAALLAHLAYRSTQHHPRARLLGHWEEMGARTGALPTPERLIFWETVPSGSLNFALEVEKDRLGPLAADAADLERERDLLMGELATRQADPAARLDLLLGERLFPLLSGVVRPDELKALTLADVQTFATDHLTRSQAVLAVVGGFQPRAVRDKLRELFADETPVKRAPVTPLKPQAPGEPIVAEGPSEYEFLYPLTGADAATVALLDGALSGGELGPWSPNQGLPTRLRTDLDRSRQVYRVRVKTELDSQVVGDKALRLKTERLTPPQLAAAQARALARFLYPLEDTAVRAVELVSDEAETGLERLSKTPERLRTVTAEALKERAIFLDANRAARGRLAPKGAAPGGGQSPGSAPPFHRHELENGITLIIQPVHELPTVTVRGFFAGGSMLDPVERPGLTWAAAKLLGRGTKAKPGEAFQNALEDAGLELRFEPGRQSVEIIGWTPADKLKTFTALLADCVRNPSVDSATFDKIRGQMLETVKSRDADPEQRALAEFLARIYPQDHPYGRPPLGKAETTATFSLAEAQNQLTRLARPDRMTLVFSGDVTEQEVLAALRPGLTSWYAETPAPLQSQQPVSQPQPASLKVASTQPYALVLLGHPGPARRDPDYYAFNLLNQILGGNPVSSRLALRIRDQERLGPVASSRLLSTAGAVPWAITMRVRPAEVDKAVAVAREELERLQKEAPKAEELARAVSMLEGRLQVSQGSAAGRADLLANLEFFRLSDSYTLGFAGLYRSIAAKDVLETARKRLHPENLVIVISTP